MTTPTTPNDDPADLVDDPVELDRFLAAYRPSGLSATRWDEVSAEAIALVKRAGVLKRLRVEKDIQTLGAVAAHLVSRGRPLTLDEALADATLLDYDLAMQRAVKSDKYRENRRGILRRLQAVQHGVPVRQRRPDGERYADLPPRGLADQLATVVAAAELDGGAAAEALLAAVASARRARYGAEVSVNADSKRWQSARAFAAAHGWPMTVNLLRAAVTHEVLLLPEPLAVLVGEAGLTRRDLDLGLTHVTPLPASPSRQHRRALRGM